MNWIYVEDQEPPKDGTVFLVAYDHGNLYLYSAACWKDNEWKCPEGDEELWNEFTHWLPIEAPERIEK